jgi:hypothetical protein
VKVLPCPCTLSTVIVPLSCCTIARVTYNPRTVGDGVVQQILERLLEAQRVAVDDEQIRRARQFQGVRLQEGRA